MALIWANNSVLFNMGRLVMEKILTIKEYERMQDEYDKVKYRCKCGHKVIIPEKVNKQICSWCGRYVFKNKKDEFEFRLKERMKKNEY